MQFIYTKNQFLPANAPFITAEDRAFRFGDGIFETLLVVNGQMVDFASHLERLSRGLEYFRMPLDVSQLEENCRALIAKNNCTGGYVRIVVSRGENGPGAIGYLPGDCAPYMVIQTLDKPYPAYGSVSLFVSSHRAHLHLPCKVNSAMLYTISMMEAREHGCDNALILSVDDFICETASASLFWVKDDVLYTPELSLPFVPGTVRKLILAHSPLLVREGRYTLADLAGADEIFMANIGGLVTKVSSIRPMGYAARGASVTDRIRALVDKAVANR